MDEATSHLVEGTAAGSVATVAMSAVMIAGDHAGLMGEQPQSGRAIGSARSRGRRPSAVASLLAPAAHLGLARERA